ncbi:MAG: aminodeoxychorismate synthase component I [Kiritimatiellae bacterium]|jgi:para-aminobenzoate synthetase/4-amino-4-deoxychorismate lyase|nr:aminodeoxychorismate synthase component I [Kiritimatiellia bacterium]
MNILEQLNKPGTIICKLPNSNEFGLFCNPEKIIQVDNPNDILNAIRQIQIAVDNNKFIAGFISYEASIVFDSAFKCKKLKNFPYLFLGIYDSFTKIKDIPEETYALPPNFFKPDISETEYNQKIKDILEHIRAGDIYQANFTIRLFGKAIDSPEKLFLSLANSHPVPYASFVNMGKTKIVSISPELFIEQNDNSIISLPMKGTAKRKPIFQQDLDQAEKLSKSKKDQAENVMIVDMVRNDFGRICQSGSIYVDPLFHVDTYKTLHQMISKVHGKIRENTNLENILKATFPAASITGAPKIRAMEIINELESSPRKVYTGSIGCILPNKKMCFNVAIRTLICEENKTELSVGSGIVADSKQKSEWKECLLKSNFASHQNIKVNLIETMLYRQNDGFIGIDAHMTRAKQSTAYFHRKWSDDNWNNAVNDTKKQLELENCKLARVRFEITENDIDVAITELQNEGWKNNIKVLISKDKVDSKNVFLYHKTTQREFYNKAFKDAISQGYDEVIFTNENDLITEGCISNIFVLSNDHWKTPKLSCGLLPGIWRAKMIKELNAQETNITLQDLKNAEKIMLCNSVRGTTNGQLTIVN